MGESKEIITDEEDGMNYHCQGIRGSTILPSRSGGWWAANLINRTIEFYVCLLSGKLQVFLYITALANSKFCT